MNNLNQTSLRISRVSIWLTLGIAFMMCAGLYQTIILKTSPPKELVQVSTPVHSSSTHLAKRGKLIDRRGRIVAASRIGYTLFVDPKLVEDPSELALELGEKLDLSPALIEEKIRARRHGRYVVLEPLLRDEQVEIAKTLNYRCIGLEQRLVREYPHGEIGNALVGLVGTEHTGLAGLENKFDLTLTGESGTLIRQRDAKKRTLWVSPEQYIPASNGEDVHLTIDVVIQDIATKRLREEIERCNAGGGRIVVADPTTGEILAMTDILNPREGWTQQPSDPNRELNARLGRNRCLTDPYEPGSTFKPFIWSVATELGLVHVDEILQTPSSQPYKTPFGRRIRDAHYYGPSSWQKVLVKSMNSGMAIVAQRLSHSQMQDAIHRFGFGEPTHIGLGGETSGILTQASNWSEYTQTSVSMGHEIAVTPLQMVQGFCAFARDGTLPQLQITPSPRDDMLIVRKAVSNEIAALTRQTMGRVMTEGTGRSSQSELYALFGKSGTAQLPRSDGKGYFEDRYISSFIAGAPIEHPRIVVLCVIDDPDKSIDHYGGVVAGPVVRDVIESSLQYLGVSPSTDYLASVAGK